MAHHHDGDMNGICGYIRSRYGGKGQEKRQKRSHSKPSDAVRNHGYGKLHKAPQVQSLHERPRNRLRKQVAPLPSRPMPKIDLFVLEYEPDTQSTQSSKVLGVYSTFDTVTLGAFKHGAFAFSREGLIDGSEYLSPTGRIKIVQTTVQRSGAKATLPERSHCLSGELVRLDIPHPKSQEEEEAKQEQPTGVAIFLAIRKGPNTASWVGIYAEKSLAWGAALKDRALCAMSGRLCDETRSIGFNNMPQITGRLIGSGRYTWMVEKHVIDGSNRTPTVLN
jgi:hypothetical protein